MAASCASVCCLPVPMPATAVAPASLAAAADPLRLYELAVQCPAAEVDFLDRRFRLLRGRSARSLCEDFCGTAAVCCEWVGRRKSNRAIGLDSDPAVLHWAQCHNLAVLPAGQARRVCLRCADVRAALPGVAPVDIVAAMNFSYWSIKERAALLRYFQRVYARLRPDGVFFLDAYGGYDAGRRLRERRAVADGASGFTYIWEQADYDPISAALCCHIHFAFPDGSCLAQAFTYDWRLWTLAELRELLAEAGFERVLCYWQGWDANGEPDGRFEPAQQAEPDAGWICYLSAEKSAPRAARSARCQGPSR